MRRLCVALVVITVVARGAKAQSAECGREGVRISSGRLSFGFDSLPGWSFSCTMGRRDMVLVVFYRSARDGQIPVTMFANVLGLDSARAESPEDAIGNDINRRRRDPDMSVTSRRDLRTKSGEPVVVRLFKSPSTNFELIAYVRGESGVAIMGLRAFDPASIDRNSRELERLVQAYTPAPPSRTP